MNKPKIFLKFLKIGAFTFGGGYAMIAVLEHELVETGLMDREEFIDIAAVAESTPGPIAINIATYVGYKYCGLLGAVIATLGICIPSFGIIFVISLFFEQFQRLELVSKAFKGIQIGVIYLIFTAGLRMFKKMKKDVFNVVIFVAVMVAFVTISILQVSFSSIFYILISGVAGLVVYSIRNVQTGGGQ